MILKYMSCFIVAVLVICASMFLSADSAVAQICSVGVIKRASPANNTPFDFTSVATGETLDFTLTDPDNPTRTIGYSPGISTITENVPSGWALTSVECVVRPGDEERISFTINGPTVTVNCTTQTILGSGRCVFTNVRTERNVPTLSEWGLIAMAGLLGIIGFYVIRRRQVSA